MNLPAYQGPKPTVITKEDTMNHKSITLTLLSEDIYWCLPSGEHCLVYSPVAGESTFSSRTSWRALQSNGVASRCTHIVKTVFEDTGKTVYTLIQRHYRLSCEDGVYKAMCLPRAEMIRLNILADGKQYLTVNGKMVFNSIKLRTLLEVLNNHSISVGFGPLTTLREYYLSRNPVLANYGLSSEEVGIYYSVCDKKQKAQVMRALKKNDTKTALQCIYAVKDAPKSLVKFAKKRPASDINLTQFKKLCAESKDLVQLSNLLNSLPHPAIAVTDVTAYQQILSVAPGCERSALVHLKRGDSTLLRDTGSMVHYADQVEGGVTHITSVEELHDVLMDSIQGSSGAHLPKLPTLNELPVFNHREYSIQSENAHSLFSIGRQLNICVGMYNIDVWYGVKNISTVRKSGKLVACLEWYSGAVVQAKLSCNQQVTKDPAVLEAVLSWMDFHGLNNSTVDLGGSRDCVPLPPKNADRLAQRPVETTYGGPQFIPQDPDQFFPF